MCRWRLAGWLGGRAYIVEWIQDDRTPARSNNSRGVLDWTPERVCVEQIAELSAFKVKMHNLGASKPVNPSGSGRGQYRSSIALNLSANEAAYPSQ